MNIEARQARCRAHQRRTAFFILACLAFTASSMSDVQAQSARGDSPSPRAAVNASNPEKQLKQDYSTVAVPLEIVLDPVADAEKSALARPEKGRPLQIGFGRDLPEIYQGDLYPRLTWVHAAGGGEVATFAVTSPGARAIRVAIAADRLPASAEVRFFGRKNAEVFGPFRAAEVRSRPDDASRAGTETPAAELFWSPVIEGDTAGVEVHVASRAEGPFLMRVAGIQHLMESVQYPDGKRLSDIGDAGACNIDVRCRTTTPALLSAAVAKIIFTEAGSTYLCTGTLLNDTDNSSFIPYFMTANHCVSTQSVANTINSYWFFERATCGGGNPSTVTHFAGGATLLLTTSDTDATFLQMRDEGIANLPGIWFAGWMVNNPTGRQADGIHHPSGDLKKWSRGVANGFANYGGAVNGTGSHIRVSWSQGTTEGGSSGSGLFVPHPSTGEQVFTGNLHGGIASCSSQSAPDWYGRFDLTYPRVRQWLEPCSYEVTPTVLTVAGSGMAGSITVTAGPECPWSATTAVPWITLTGTGGRGNGSIGYTVATNSTSSPRSGSLTVAGRQVIVSQGPLTTSLIDRYRLYSPVTLEHLYTTDRNEYNVLGGSPFWHQEGVASKLHNGPVTVSGVAAVPYYRVYDKIARWHHWTTDQNEYIVLGGITARYDQEGVDGYIFKTQVAGTVPWYRLLHTAVPGLHHWTTDANERDILLSRGWIEEAREFVFPPGPTATTLTQDLREPARDSKARPTEVGSVARSARGNRHQMDLNGDGVGDVFVYNPATGAWQFELSNAVTGGFTGHTGVWLPGLQVYAAHLNADVFVDFVGYDPVQGTWVQALNSHGEGFAYTSGTWAPGLTVVPADLDGDGLKDLLAYQFTTGAWTRYLVDGAGGFTDDAAGAWNPGWTVVPADLTGDGRDDLLLYDPATGAWLEAVSQSDVAAFDYAASGYWLPNWKLLAGDLDGNGRADLVLYDDAGVHATAASLREGGFDLRFTGQLDAGATMAIGDLNADGRSDIFVYTPATGAWTKALSDGSGSFRTIAGTEAPGWSVTLLDLNADGACEIIFSRADGTWVRSGTTRGGIPIAARGTWASGGSIVNWAPSNR